MSLPRPPSHSHSQSHSSSPSKSSLRSTNSHSRPNSRGLLPSPKFDDIVRFHPHPSTSATATAFTASTAIQQRQQQSFQVEYDNEEAIASSTQQAAEEADNGQAEEEDGSRRDFAPFFTLIADKTTGAYFHPTLHYVFADDDPELITAAACDQLARYEPSTQQASTGKTSLEGSKKDRRNEHVLIVDVAPTVTSRNPSSKSSSASASYQAAAAGDAKQIGSAPPPQPAAATAAAGGRQDLAYTVTSASSLSASWQVLRSEITPAPTFDAIARTASPTGNEGGLMLRIEGTGVLDDGDGGGRSAGGEEERTAGAGGKSESLEEMVRRFEEGLGVVRSVLGGGGHGHGQRGDAG